MIDTLKMSIEISVQTCRQIIIAALVPFKSADNGLLKLLHPDEEVKECSLHIIPNIKNCEEFPDRKANSWAGL